MNNLTRVSAVVIGLFGATGAISVALVACGNDATGIVDGGGPDAQGDGPAKNRDGGRDAARDARPDSTHPDGGVPDSTPDVTRPLDATPETSTDAHDGGSDAHDGGSDAHDGASDDAHDAQPGFDATAETDFITTLVNAYCTKMQSCCGVDGGAFSIADCVMSQTDSYALPTTDIGLIFGATASPHHTFDAVQAQTCLTDLKALQCGANTAGALNNVSAACSAVYTGLLGQGDTGCRSSFDCASGTYCGPINSFGITSAADGGTCLPLGSIGAPCVDQDYSSDCTYLGSGSPGAFCSASNVCAPSQLTGTDCSNPGYAEQCVTQICTFDSTNAGTCAGSELFTQPAGTDFCPAFPPQ
jgi:hypothetical protein